MNTYNVDREEYFFRHNCRTMQGGSVLVIVCCIFWMVVDIIGDGYYMLVRSGCVYFLSAMILASALELFFQFRIKKQLDSFSKESVFDVSKREKALLQDRAVKLIFAIVLIVGVSSIIVANDMWIESGGNNPLPLSISLSTTLLLLPVLTPSPRKEDGIIIFVIGLIAIIFPLYAPGSECFAMLPELVMRLGLAFTYEVMFFKVNEGFSMQHEINEYNEKIRRRDRKIMEMNEDVVELMADVVELRDTESGEHITRVKRFTNILAESIKDRFPEYELNAKNINIIVKASALHDLGKIMIPDSILLKPARLTPEEFEEMKTHSRHGYEILKKAPKSWDEDFLMYSREITLYHHERYDGKGYPEGLVGDEIPISAQIVAVADCYDALTSNRRYKDAFSDDEAFNMIMNGECGSFSPKILECFAECREDFAKCRQSINDEKYYKEKNI